MKYLGNIVIDGKFENSKLYNVVKDLDNIIEDIPTLIVGYKKVKSLFDTFSMLDWKISKNVYWTYGRREKGERYVDDIEKFKTICFNYAIDNVKYKLFNVLTETIENKKKFFLFLKNDIKKTVYLENDMIYIYYDNKHVTGFSLSDVEYGGGNKNKTLSIIYSNKNNKILNNNEVLKKEYFTKFRNKPYIIPYLYG